MTRNKILAIVAVVIIALALILAFVPNKADAVGSTTCVPTPATTEVVVVTPAIPATPGTPAIPAVPGTPAVPAVPPTPAVPAVYGPDLWWNWSPNHQQGPFEGPPAFPVDSRGTWQGPHANGGPMQGTYGTFQTNDNGNGNWFHREKGVVITPEVPATPGTPEIPATPGTPAVPAVPGTPEVPAVTKTVTTPAVECPETETPNPTPTPEAPEPEKPEAPAPEDEDPVISKHTSHEPGKTTVTLTHESGKVTEEVRVYDTETIKEEGL